MDTGLPMTSPPPYYNITGCTPAGHGVTSSMDSITSNGGFIAMAAGLSIVIPIVSVLVVQLRRAKLAERARLNAAPVATDIEADDPRIIDLPPPYEQVFSSNFNSFTTVVHPVHSRNFEILINENESVQQQRNGYTDDQRENELANVFRELQPPGVTNVEAEVCDGQAYSGSLISHPDNSDSLIATISGSDIAEIAGGSHVSLTSNIDSQNTSIPHILQLGTHTDSPTISEPASSPSHHAHLLLTPSHRDRTNNSEHISADVYSQVAPRRPPGMHISFEDFSAGGYLDNQGDSPPPSYEEALHILETIEYAKDHLY